MRSFLLLGLMTLSFGGLEVAQAQSVCAPPKQDPIEGTPVSEVQKCLVTNEFERLQAVFAQGKLPEFSDFDHRFKGEFKPTWSGSCFSSSGESRPAKILASSNSYKGKEFRGLAVRPEWREDDQVAVYKEFSSTSVSSHAQDPVRADSAFLSHGAGIPALFTLKSALTVAHYRRVESSDGSVKIVAELKEPIRVRVSDERDSREKQAIEHGKSGKSAAFCEFTERFGFKITRREKTEGCVGYYQQYKERYKKATRTKYAIGAALFPMNFVMGGALIGSTAAQKNPEKSFDEMAEFLAELRSSGRPTPQIDAIYAAVTKAKPDWGSREALVKLLNTANDSFVFCEPHLPERWYMTTQEVAESIAAGTLSEELFVR